jgi:hypothetical protein
MKRTDPKTLKYIGENNDFIYGKTYFVYCIDDQYCTVFARDLFDNIRVNLLKDLKENFIEVSQFSSHVQKILLK